MSLGIYVDLDETLIKQAPWKLHPAVHEVYLSTGIKLVDLFKMKNDDLQDLIKENVDAQDIVVENVGGHKTVISVRPGAVDFLYTLRQITDNLICLTAGKTSHQEDILNKSGLFSFFKEIIGCDKYDVCPQFKEWFLFDDLPPWHNNSAMKLRAIGAIRENFNPVPPWAPIGFIQVPPYDGMDGERNPLIKSYKEMMAKSCIERPEPHADFYNFDKDQIKYEEQNIPTRNMSLSNYVYRYNIKEDK